MKKSPLRSCEIGQFVGVLCTISRAIVTTDHPGCREAIIPNESGLLVPINNPEKLADALQWLIEHPVERVAMGKAGRLLAEREFAIENIVIIGENARLAWCSKLGYRSLRSPPLEAIRDVSAA